MNKIYKVIWSKVKACYVVVSELAKRHSKGKSLKSAASLVALTAILAFLPVQVNATDVAPGDNIAQLKALNTKVDNLPSIHYFSVKSDDSANPDGTNWKNDGASGENAIAIGKDAKAKTKASVVVGLNASSGDAATDGVAVGNTASVTGFGGVAIGRKSSAQGQETVAIGTGAKGVLNGTIAIGGYANADGVGAVSIGRGSSSKRLGVSVGVKSFSEELGVSVGTQSFSNLRSVAVGEEAKAESKYSVAVGDQTASYAEAGVTLGNKTRVYGDSSVAIGNEARVSGKPLTEAEYNALPDAEKSSYKVQVARYPNPADPMNPTIEKTYFKVFNAADWNAETHYNSIAIGTTSFVEAKEAIGIGAATWIHGDRGVALGYTAVSGEKGTALGAGAQAKANAGVALGEGAVADTAAKVAGYDPQTGKASTETTPTWKSMKGAVSVGNADATRQITNLAAGSADTDAVNVAQLKALNQKVDDGAVHYYSVKSDQQGAGTNYANDGAKAADSMVIGISSSISEKAKNSTVLGNNNTLSNQPNARGVERDSENNSIVVGQNLTVEGARNAVFGTDYQNGTDKLLTHVAGERNTVIGVGNLVGYTAERVGTEWKYTKFKGHGDDENVVVGLTNTVNGGGVVVGTNTTVSAYGGVAFGHHNTVSGDEDKGVALGNDLNVSGYGALAVGTESAATGDYTIALGVESKAQALMAASMGYDSQAKASGSVALGAWSSAEAKQALALGYDSQAMVAGGVALGAKSVANTEAGKIGYVAGGSNATFDDLLTALGKKEAYDGWTAKVNASKTEFDQLTAAYDNAANDSDKATAKAALDAWKNMHGDFVEALSAKTSLETAWKSNMAAVSVGRNEVNKAGNTVVETRQITNLAAGTEDTDAVNVAQLKALNRKVDEGAVHYFSVNADDSAAPADTNWNNDGAKSTGSIAVGQKARTLELPSDALQTPEKISSDNAVALGSEASAAGKGSVAIGKNAVTGTRYATNPFGLVLTKNIAGDGAVAVGDSSQAATEGSVAVGRNAIAGRYEERLPGKKVYGIAIGDGAKAIGPARQNTGGADQEDAGLAVGYQAYAAGNGTITMGYKAHAENTQNIIIGSNATTEALLLPSGSETVHPICSIGIGADAVVKGRFSVAVGTGASVGNGQMHLSTGSGFLDFGGVALGYKSQVDRPGSVGLGSWTRPWRQGDQAAEQTKYAHGTKVIAPFSGQKLYFKDDIGGAQVYNTMGDNSVVNGVVSVGGVYEERNRKIPFLRQIINVGDGTEDTDAVNLRQLKAVNDKLDTTSTTAGTALQSWDAQIGGKKVKTVNKDNNTLNFIAGNNISLTNDSGNIKIATSDNVKFNNVTVGDVVINKDDGINAGGKKITNVAVGENNTDAVNMSQLNGVNTSVTNNTKNITALQSGFTVSNAAGTKQDITLGGATKQNIKFQGEENKIDVAVEADGTAGAKVTVKANPNLGKNIDLSNNSTITAINNSITTLQGGFNVKSGTNEGAIKPGETLEFAGENGVETKYGATDRKLTIGLDKATKDKIDNIGTTINETAQWTIKDGTAADAGKGLWTPRDYDSADALITDVPGLPLVVFSADCNVILLYDPVRRAVGAAHAGWRGTAAGIAGKTVRAMRDAYGCDPADIRAAIGPAIGPCCFETDNDVPDALREVLGDEAAPFMTWNGRKWHIDLKAVNALWLRKAGVTRIDTCADCTFCRTGLYWSHRKTGLRRGEQAALIALREVTP